MDRSFDIFISYAGEDSVFARQLVQWLEDASLSVWFAEEDMRGGAEIQEEIATTVPKCRHAVFVISEHWLEKDWTLWERDLVLDNAPEDRRVLCLMRGARDIGKLGPKLNLLKSIDWYSDEPEPDAPFWELLCGLGLFALGKKKDWAKRGHEARGETGSNILASTMEAAETRGVMLAAKRSSTGVLTCDRDVQWGAFSRMASDSQHSAVLVPGPIGEGHKWFLQRVVDCLPRDPKRRVCEISWNGACVPQARGPAMAAIAEAIECAPERLEQSLHQILAEQNLVLVHQPPFEESEPDAMIRYYTDWLPGLVDKIAPFSGSLAGKLKFVQAIRWPQASFIEVGIGRAAGLFGSESGLSRRVAKIEAAKTLAKELDRSSGSLHITFLDELSPITEQDVEKWSYSLPLDDSTRARLVKHALDGENSADILNRIAERLDP